MKNCDKQALKLNEMKTVSKAHLRKWQGDIHFLLRNLKCFDEMPRNNLICKH
uniref:Bm727 n=1 Tax=Brugia malayi TaxID=6279 RepID=A0A1I9G5B2_BRUMA|nr:Bm727 [Brugia malayi]